MSAIKYLSEKEFALQVVRLLPGHIYWKDVYGRFLGCNDAQAKAFQLNSPEDIIGTTDFDYYPQDQAQIIVNNDHHVMAVRQLQTIEETGVLPGQGEKTFLSKKIPLVNDADEVIGILGVSVDITDRKRAEIETKNAKEQAEDNNRLNSQFLAKLLQEVTGKEIDESQLPLKSAEEMRDYLESIIAAIPGHVYWHDRNMVFLGCNDLQAKHAGLKSRYDIIGKTLDQILDPKIAAELNAANQQVMSSGEAVMKEEFAVMENGPGYYLSHKVPLRDRQGEVIGALGLSFDITPRKQEEEALKKAKQYAEEASQTKSRFIANMSHDIRTPLTGILGMAEILSSRLKSKDEKALVDTLINSGQRLTKLLNQILEYASIEADNQPLKILPLDLTELVREALDLSRGDDSKNRIPVIFYIDPAIPRFIAGDQMRLGRILLNLIGNALRFTNSGEINVKITLSEENKQQMIITVSDTGIGIPSDKLGIIFEPFCRLNNSYQGKYEGVGLGLHIVKQFVKDLNGSIHVNSIENKGTTFVVRLPLLLLSEQQLSAAQKRLIKKEFLSEKSGNPLRILLVEDDSVCQLVAKTMLTDMEHKVDVALSGADASEKLKTPYELILMDIGLPDTDGLSLAKTIRAGDGCNKNTTIIALTAHVSREYSEQFVAAGMDAVLFKPFSIQELRTVLTQISH